MSPAAAFAKVDIFLLFWRLTLPPNPFIIETDFIRGFIIMNFKKFAGHQFVIIIICNRKNGLTNHFFQRELRK